MPGFVSSEAIRYCFTQAHEGRQVPCVGAGVFCSTCNSVNKHKMVELMDRLVSDWRDGLSRGRGALLVICGASDDVVQWSELFDEHSLPASLDHLIERAMDNVLRFRANYSRIFGVWAAICAIRHPFGAFWVVLTCFIPFHGLVVRRGIVHISLPRIGASTPTGTPLTTLVYPGLHVALALASIGVLAFAGRIRYTLWLLLPPVAVSLVHAASKHSPRRGEAKQMANELRIGLRTALRADADTGTEELEGGRDELEPPERHDDMAKRIEAIREKFRPPSVLSNGRASTLNRRTPRTSD
jgi:uncharacterized membrane protein YqaE (UPF0057 family)